jgi:hypothetical protein
MKDTQFISIARQKIPFSYEMRDIFELKFYPENPRIASIIAKRGEKVDDDFIHRNLWDRNTTHRLKRNIEDHGGLQHPVIVYDDYVIEGNTRLCCFRHLWEETKDEKWRKINCQILLEALTKKQVNLLLGNEHIVGKIDWDTYEKGCWLTRMYKQDGYSYDDIKEITRLSIPLIKTHIDAYKTMVKENIFDTRKFSHFVQLFSNSEIKKIKKQKDPTIVEKVVTAIKNDQFKDARDIRKVPAICKDKKSKKRFFDQGEDCEQVYIDLKAKAPTIDSVFSRSVEDLTARLCNLTVKERAEVAASKRELDKIKRLAREVLKLCKELKVNVRNILRG